MIAPTPFFTDRGCHIRILEEIRALQARGHRVTLCTYGLGRDVPGVKIRRIAPLPWYRKTAAGPSVHKYYLDLFLLAASLAVARRERPDVIHAHLHEGMAIGRVVTFFTMASTLCLRGYCRQDGKPSGRRKPRRPSLVGAIVKRTPVIFDYQGSLTGELISHRYVRPYGARFRLLRSAEAWIDRSADAIVTSCAQARDQILASFPIDPSRVSVVEDGIDTEAFQPAVAAAPARQALGIPAERRVIVYLGLLTPYQGVDCLIQAMPRVLARVPQAHLLLLGWPDEQRYRDMAAAAGVGERVTLAGKVEYARSAELLAAGEVAVAPKLSTSESNGKLRHYMACGLPTVAFDLPMNREVLGDLGIYAGAQNSEALAAALVTALSDRSRSAAIGRELRAAAVRDHGWWRAAEKLERVYERQLEGRGP